MKNVGIDWRIKLEIF